MRRMRTGNEEEEGEADKKKPAKKHPQTEFYLNENVSPNSGENEVESRQKGRKKKVPQNLMVPSSAHSLTNIL